MSTKFGVNASVLQPKSVILSWLNNLLKLDLTKIEELGSGNIYCQLLDVIYPGQVPMNKIKWKAKNENDFLHNFRVLQNTFDKLKIIKALPKLAQAKYQDNLEFIQWFKKFFDVNCKEKGKGYNALLMRNNSQPDFSWIKRGAPPKYTLVYNNKGSKSQKTTNIIGKDESQSQTQEEESERLVDTVQKKIKINQSVTPMRTFFRQSSMPDSRTSVTPNQITFKNTIVPKVFETQYGLKNKSNDENLNTENTQKLNIFECENKQSPKKPVSEFSFQKSQFEQQPLKQNPKIMHNESLIDFSAEKININLGTPNGKENLLEKTSTCKDLLKSTLFEQSMLIEDKKPEKSEQENQKILENILDIIQNCHGLDPSLKLKKIQDLIF